MLLGSAAHSASLQWRSGFDLAYVCGDRAVRAVPGFPRNPPPHPRRTTCCHAGLPLQGFQGERCRRLRPNRTRWPAWMWRTSLRSSRLTVRGRRGRVRDRASWEGSQKGSNSNPLYRPRCEVAGASAACSSSSCCRREAFAAVCTLLVAGKRPPMLLFVRFCACRVGPESGGPRQSAAVGGRLG